MLRRPPVPAADLPVPAWPAVTVDVSSGMVRVANIRDWRGHDVVDDRGGKIGRLEAVYVDTATDEPAFASVTVGVPGRRRLVFVPLDGATVAPGHVAVAYPKRLVRDAPAIDVDGELLAEQEAPLFDHYGMTYRQGAGGERRLARR